MKTSNHSESEGEFLWLVSLSDLMILLFVFFVVLFSFSIQKMNSSDFQNISTVLKGQKKVQKTPVDEVQEQLKQALKENNLTDAVELRQKDQALILEIKEKVLFESGSFHLKENSSVILHLISNAVKNIPSPYRLGVEGHTDDVPIHSSEIADNWELSAKRAHSVLMSLNLGDNLGKRALIMGFGEMEPLFPNRDENGNPLPLNQAKNRRVTLRIF